MAKETSPLVDALANEHIRLAGCPQLVVNRGWAYQWFTKTLGMSVKIDGGFGSADFLAWGSRSVNEPLTDLSEPAVMRFLLAVAKAETGADQKLPYYRHPVNAKVAA